jgi:methylaspartate ammonia-lyase
VKVNDVICSVGESGSFNTDHWALVSGAKATGGRAVEGKPVSPGFKSIVQPGSSLSVILCLDDGQVAFGDCADVALTGLAGRDPLFVADDHARLVADDLRRRLVGRDPSPFRLLAEEFDGPRRDGGRFHSAVRYGITQALLEAASLARRVTMAEVIAEDYDCEVSPAVLPLLIQVSQHSPRELDQAILKGAQLLPHFSFHHVENDVGRDGTKLLQVAERVIQRIREIRGDDYRPIIHFDLYGTMGGLFDGDIDATARYLGRLQAVVAPHELLIETPIIAESREAQIDVSRSLRSAINGHGFGVKIVADEWANTLGDIKEFADAQAADYIQIKTPDLGGINNSIEAALYVRARGIGAYIGGTSNETDQSARVSAHVALATRPAFALAKPGNNDLGYMIMRNEMLRALALIRRRPPNFV